MVANFASYFQLNSLCTTRAEPTNSLILRLRFAVFESVDLPGYGAGLRAGLRFTVDR